MDLFLLLLTGHAAAFQPLSMRWTVRSRPLDSCWKHPSSLDSALYLAATSERSLSSLSETRDSLSFLDADRQGTTFEMPEIHNRTLSKTESEFRELLGDFAHFSERDIQSVPSPRMRTVFEGIKASAGEPQVYLSFEILFTDFYPIRFAGRLIHKKLLQTMADSQVMRQQQVESIAHHTGLPREEVDLLRIAFLSIAQENHFKNGQVFLSKQQLQESGIGDIVLQGIGYANVDAFFDVLDANSDGRLSFEELMMGLYSNAVDSCFGDVECDPSQVLHALLAPLLNDDTTKHHRVLDEKHQRYSDRYDEMIETFADWEIVFYRYFWRRTTIGCIAGLLCWSQE